MPTIALREELERLHAAYNECSEQLGELLNEVREMRRPSLEMMAKIKELNRHCDELLDKYIAAYKDNYGDSNGQGAQLVL